MKTRELFYSILVLGFVLNPVTSFAVDSAPDPNISVYPTTYVFGEIDPNSSTASATFTVKNTGGVPLVLGVLGIADGHNTQYQLGTDNCSGQTLAADTSCTAEVTYNPDARGHKQATLDILSDTPNTTVLQAFLTSREDLVTESARRLPPVLSAINIPETMTAGTTYNLTWTVLGYHEDYDTWIAFFDCTTDPVDCGSSYSNPTRFEQSAKLSKVGAATTPVAGWNYQGNQAQEFHYEFAFTPDAALFSQSTDIVVRIYRRNTDDGNAKTSSLSLLIPGNLSDRYFDDQGRRIVKTIVPM
ncbi:MAG: choice-of-anchor D domain-containing protein [Thiotrichaceae bacterium]